MKGTQRTNQDPQYSNLRNVKNCDNYFSYKQN